MHGKTGDRRKMGRVGLYNGILIRFASLSRVQVTLIHVIVFSAHKERVGLFCGELETVDVDI